MELVNESYKYKDNESINTGLLKAAVDNLVKVLSPFTPHICEEMWEILGHDQPVYSESWPAFDEAALVKDEVEIVTQVNGKLKDKMMVANGLSREEQEKVVMDRDKTRELIGDKNVIKVVSVPGKLVNIVVK